MRSSRFPDPRTAPADEPLAHGGDVEPDTLLEAYTQGIFPWPDQDGYLWWWSPDPRAILPLDGFHVSRSLQRTLRSARFTHTRDQAFADVVASCGQRPDPREGTWITPWLADAFIRMHQLGYAHSVEVWDSHGELVGGVYGLALGGAFMAESMFYRATDASKVALHALIHHLRTQGFALLDVQVPTAHLESLGARTIPRAAYLELLADALAADAHW